MECIISKMHLKVKQLGDLGRLSKSIKNKEKIYKRMAKISKQLKYIDPIFTHYYPTLQELCEILIKQYK